MIAPSAARQPLLSRLSCRLRRLLSRHLSDYGVPPSKFKPPPKAEWLDTPCPSDKPSKYDNPPPKSSFRAKLAQHTCEQHEKNKKKKRPPSGPVQFEELTAKTPVHSDLPFAFRYSYTEVPPIAPVGFQDKFSPFGPGRLDRVWDGQQALPASSLSSSSSSSFQPLFQDSRLQNMDRNKYSFKNIKLVNPPSPMLFRRRTKREMTRDEVIGEPLTQVEIQELVEAASKKKTRRQINLGRDGLTHNMLIEAHDHWKRQPVVRVKCKGVPTVDMDNVLFHLEDKTGGKIIRRVNGTVYLFRGRNYSYKDRPIIPPMLWKPHAPLYPRLITDSPGGLKVHEANYYRKRGLKIMPLTILRKNGYYGDLVMHVREAFEDDNLVRIDCTGFNNNDPKKIGAKLRDLVPCYLLSFLKEQIVLWSGNRSEQFLSASEKDGGSGVLEEAECHGDHDSGPEYGIEEESWEDSSDDGFDTCNEDDEQNICNEDNDQNLGGLSHDGQQIIGL